jgi:hypothetical protein
LPFPDFNHLFSGSLILILEKQQIMNKSIAESFYQALGKLFYSIAAADKKIHPNEVEKLHELVLKNWVPLEPLTDEFATDLAFGIEFSFDWLAENATEPEAALNDFITFKKENSELFSPEVNSLIWKTALSVAHAYAGKNKSELKILHRVGKELQAEALNINS